MPLSMNNWIKISSQIKHKAVSLSNKINKFHKENHPNWHPIWIIWVSPSVLTSYPLHRDKVIMDKNQIHRELRPIPLAKPSSNANLSSFKRKVPTRRTQFSPMHQTNIPSTSSFIALSNYSLNLIFIFIYNLFLLTPTLEYTNSPLNRQLNSTISSREIIY